MKKTYIIGILAIVAIAAGFAADQQAQASGLGDIIGQVDTTKVIIILALGGGGGILYAYQGARTTPNDFDALKFVDGILHVFLGTLPVVAVQILLPDYTYLVSAFTAIGFGQQFQKSRQQTIPNNASDEEIQAILDARG